MRLLIACLALVAVSVAGAATPKPWQWTPLKAQKRLVTAQPFVFDTATLESATCVGRKPSVAGRFSKFRCTIAFGSYTAPVTIRILPVGSGKLCVVTAIDGYTPGTLRVQVAPARRCPV